MTSPERSNEDQDDSATSVAAIESQKENIVPLPQGRSASQLSSLLQFASPARHARLAERHAEFAREVEGAADLDDPLEVHYRYVRWIQDNYPQGQSAESNLLPVLERLTRSFRQDRRYRNDPRYIRCWILYAQNISDPNVVFEYMQVNDLGQDLHVLKDDVGIRYVLGVQDPAPDVPRVIPVASILPETPGKTFKDGEKITLGTLTLRVIVLDPSDVPIMDFQGIV